MELYLTVCFWMYVIAVPLKIWSLAAIKFPTTKTFTLFEELLNTFAIVGFGLWVTYLKFFAG